MNEPYYKGQEVLVDSRWAGQEPRLHFAIIKGITIGLLELTWQECGETCYGYTDFSWIRSVDQ